MEVSLNMLKFFRFFDSNEKFLRILFILVFFIFLFLWAYRQPFNSSPDERMRYVMPKYIYDNGTLPRADDPTIVDEKYGHSYAGRPMLSYFISVFFMKICSFFYTSDFALLMAARMGSIACGIGFVIFIMKIADELFSTQSTRWLFIILTCLWPQGAFMFTYVNCDALALFSVAIIIYYWICGAKNNWNISSCVGLGIGLAMGIQSYYNMYGYVLCSAILFILYHILANHSEKKYREMFSKGFLIAGIVFVLAGWFFIRNAVLYDGDFLGNKITLEMGNTYGAYGARPMDQSANSLARLKTFDGIIRWILLTCRSFIGCFGYMSIPLKWWMYVIYCIEILIGLLGIIVLMKKIKNGVYTSKFGNFIDFAGSSILTGCIIASCTLTLLLHIYYNTLDYQPQGRYLLPALIPFTFLLTIGTDVLQNHNKKNIYTKILFGANIFIFTSIPYIFY